MTETFYRPEDRQNIGATTGKAGNQPWSIPVLSDPPTNAELPTDNNGNPTGLLYHDTTDDITKITLPDGAGGTATATVVDLSASVSLGGTETGLL